MSFIKNLISYFVKYPVLANILIAVTLLGGVVSMLNTKKSFFPTRNERFININVTYLGASPEELEEGVTLKVEEAVKTVPGIYELTSKSQENSARITIEIIESYDINEVYTEVKNAVDAINGFPSGAEKPVVSIRKQRSVAQWLALTSKNETDNNLKKLKKYAQDIRDDLLKNEEVSSITIFGFQNLEISIEISEQQLLRYNLTFDQVAQIVRASNKDISAGTIKSPNEELLIRSNAKETDAKKISDIVVRSNGDGTTLLLSDIATVKEDFAEDPNKTLINGKEAVFLQINKLEVEDLEKISIIVNKYVEEFAKTTSDVELTVTWDFMSMLKQRLDLLTSNGIVGLALVLLSLGLFLSIRLSFWVAWGIPSSFLGLFIMGTFVGFTINMISLFGMILVIGILVDDGIVIAENIFSHFEKTKNPIKSAIDGTMEVLPAVFTSVTTTIIAFTPLLLLTGGFEFLRDMAIVVCFSLGFSLLEAFFVLPAHLASKSVLSIKKEDTRSYKIRKALNNFIDFQRTKVYGRLLKFSIKNKAISTALMLSFIIIIVGLLKGGQIKATFFPQIPFNSFNVDILFKPGEREHKTLSYLERFDSLIWEVNKDLQKEKNTDIDVIKQSFLSLGSTSSGELGSHAGNVNVFYEELDQFDMNQFDLIKKIEEKIGNVPEAETFKVGGASRFGKPVSLTLLGKNYKELIEAKEFLKSELRQLTELKEVDDNVSIGSREMQFGLKEEAYFLGLNHDVVANQLRQGFFGEEIQRFMKGQDEVKVWIRYPKEERRSLSQLESIKIKTTDNKEYPLTQIVDYTVERSVSGIRHHNTARSITVDAEMIDPFGEVPPIVNRVKNEIVPKLKANYPTIAVDFGGQSKESSRSMKQISLYFGSAFVIIFFVIMVTFKSYYQALLIITMIPLGWFGAILGHGIEDWISPGKELPVSILSAWGMVALSGVIINDAVIFLSKYNSLIKNDKLPVMDAVYQAGLARFRPIMLTSLTTVLGLYPLIKETSFQAQFLIPMAISVAYGVLIGTFIILFFFPVLILIFNDVRRNAVWLWTGVQPSREEVERVIIDEKRIEKYKKIS